MKALLLLIKLTLLNIALPRQPQSWQRLTAESLRANRGYTHTYVHKVHMHLFIKSTEIHEHSHSQMAAVAMGGPL